MTKCPQCGGNLYPDGCRLCPMFEAAAAPGGTPASGWPLVSSALGVHPRQVKAANERNRKHGVNVQYDPKTGRAHIPDRGERGKLLKLERMHDNNSFTGN